MQEKMNRLTANIKEKQFLIIALYASREKMSHTWGLKEINETGIKTIQPISL